MSLHRRSPSSFFFYLCRYGLRKRHFRKEGVVIEPGAQKRRSGDNRKCRSRISPATLLVPQRAAFAIKIENYNSIPFFLFPAHTGVFVPLALFHISLFLESIVFYSALKFREKGISQDTFVGRIRCQWQIVF